MNVETGEIKAWSELTEEEKSSGRWARLENGLARRLGAAELVDWSKAKIGVDPATGVEFRNRYERRKAEAQARRKKVPA